MRGSLERIGIAAFSSVRRLGLASFLAGFLATPLFGQSGEGSRSRTSDPITAELSLSRGILEFEQGRYGEALERLSGADGASAPYYRGLSLMALRRASEALREFETVHGRPGAPVEVELDAGVARLATGDAARAEAGLRDYVKRRDDDPYGHYFLGVALFRQKQYAEAETEFRSAATDAALSPHLNFYRRLIASARSGTDAQAVLASNSSVTEASSPGNFYQSRNGQAAQLDAIPGQAVPGQPVLNGVTGPSLNRRWNFTSVSSYEYDTNVAISPSIVPLGLGSFGKPHDSRYASNSFAEYRIIQREQWVLGLIGSAYDSFQFHLQQYNLQDYMGGAYTNVSLTSNLILGTRYEFHDALLGGREFLYTTIKHGHQFFTEHRFTPNLTYREGSFGHTTAFYELDSLDIKNVAPVFAQGRSGRINAVGVTQAIYLFESAGRFFASYRYEQAKTQGADFDRSTNMVDARLEIPLAWKVVANLESRYFWDDYKNPNSIDALGRARNDRRIEARVGFQKFFNPRISLRVDYVYTNNHSNVQNGQGQSFYSYDRSLFSTLLIWDF